jgi:hypothetical protein
MRALLAVVASSPVLAHAAELLWAGGVTHELASFRVECATDTDVFLLYRPGKNLNPIIEVPVQKGLTAIDSAPLPDLLVPDTLYYYGLRKALASAPGSSQGQFRTLPVPRGVGLRIERCGLEGVGVRGRRRGGTLSHHSHSWPIIAWIIPTPAVLSRIAPDFRSRGRPRTSPSPSRPAPRPALRTRSSGPSRSRSLDEGSTVISRLPALFFFLFLGNR